jgi:16S rRNA (cytosine967-C5)-methyltransferase
MMQTALTRNSPAKKSHKASPARYAALKILAEFNRNLKPLNLVLHGYLRRTNLSREDRSLATELVNGSVRWQIQSDWFLSQFVHGRLNQYPAEVQEILRCSVYQLRHLEQIPDYAVLDEAVTLARNFRQLKYARLINGVLRNYLRNQGRIRFPDLQENLAYSLSVRYAFPEWMVALFLDQYGRERAETILASMNERPQTTLRINMLKTGVEEYRKCLDEAGILSDKGMIFPEYLRLLNLKGSIRDLPGYDHGLFSVQDESAGFVGRLAMQNVRQRLVEICVAPGGKISHLAELTSGQKMLVGLDLSWSRLRMVRDNLGRMDVKSVQLVRADGTRLPFKPFDAGLIDAPCSGLGVIRKSPDIKIRRQPGDLNEILKIQWQLLSEAGILTNPGGILIYSTCTINRDENERMIERFLRSFPTFSIEPPAKIFPENWVSTGGWIETAHHLDDIDGTYCVLLRKVK